MQIPSLLIVEIQAIGRGTTREDLGHDGVKRYQAFQFRRRYPFAAGIEANDTCDVSIFNPANPAEGIGHPPDEIFAARSAAYTISLAKRR